MNLTEALDTSLPEIPALAREFKPRIHPNLIWREHQEGGTTTITALVPEKGYIFRFTPLQWQLVQLFDGKRTLEEVSELYLEQTGIQYTVEELRESVATMDASEFWYKTPLEQNISLKQRLAEERKKKTEKKSKYGDVSHMEFGAWDPDRALDYLHPKLKFIYSRWFAVLSVTAFVFMLYVFYDRWAEIGHDTYLFYNFREKTLRDIAEFWCLSCLVLFVHEGAHGLTCKHYGGHVHRMGFLLLYLTPAFFTDATQVFVYGSKWERVNTIFWGAWSEIMICSIATPIWWGTPPGSLVHEWAYKLMLITGLAVFFFNWNPLIKLDGYYLLTEALGWPDLKEASTAYVSTWVKKHVWRLPVAMPYVTRKQRLPYVIYALLSGAYSYLLLYAFSRFIGNVASSFSPSWGFLVGLAVGYRIFRSRVRSLGRFTKTLYLDKKEWLQSLLPPQRQAVAGAVVLVLLFAPILHDTAEGRFILEPVNRAIVHSEVAGYIEAVYVAEGQQIQVGAPLFDLRNLELETTAARVDADAHVSTARATEAQLKWENVAQTRNEQQRLAEQRQALIGQLAKLKLRSPLSGTVVTSHLNTLFGSYVQAGTELVEVADTSRMRARVYIPEFETRRAAVGNTASLLCESSLRPLDGMVVSRAPGAYEIEPGLLLKSSFKGIRLPNFYVYEVIVENPSGDLRTGMVGTAKLYGRRRSIAGLIWEPIGDFLARKLW